MKLLILQQDLLPALTAVSRSVGVKASLPVLGNILLQTEKGKLKLASTNLEIGVIKLINAQILEEGDITVPVKAFLEVVTSLSGAKISLESLTDQLSIVTDNFHASLNGISASEFPSIPISSDSTISLGSAMLQKSIPQISFAAAADEGRPILTGILTEVKKDCLELVATDGFRLAHKLIKTKDTKTDGGLRVLIPRRTFEEVVRLITEDLKGEEENEQKIVIATSKDQNQMIFRLGQTIVSSRLIEGQFPAWEKIIPTNFENRTIIDRIEFQKACKLASIFARTEANIIKIQTDEGKLRLTSEAKELGGQQTEVEAQTQGSQITIAFNGKFLLEALSACLSSQVSIEFSGNLSPALIKPLGEEGLEYVIMPIRLN